MIIGAVNWSKTDPQSSQANCGFLTADERLRDHVLFETSGSTGAPKQIALSKSALEASARAVNWHLQVDANSCWGLTLPSHHVGGFGVLLRSQLAACRLAQFAEKWQPKRFQAWADQEQLSHLALVPTQVFDLVANGITAPKSLRAVVVGGGHLDPQIGQRARDLGWPVLASFGMTEAASQIATQPLADLQREFRAAPIGVLPHWSLAVDHTNRLRLSGPALFSGILVFSENQWVYQPRTEKWFETNDRVTLSDQGLTPLQRIDTLVKVLGELVDPLQIEAEIIASCGGTLAAGSFVIVAVPAARSEHALIAVADAKTTEAATWQSAISAYQASAPGFRRLQQIARIHDFPRGGLDKPRRAEIAHRFSPADPEPSAQNT